jgi:hypothetical protein
MTINGAGKVGIGTDSPRCITEIECIGQQVNGQRNCSRNIDNDVISTGIQKDSCSSGELMLSTNELLLKK